MWGGFRVQGFGLRVHGDLSDHEALPTCLCKAIVQKKVLTPSSKGRFTGARKRL